MIIHCGLPPLLVFPIWNGLLWLCSPATSPMHWETANLLVQQHPTSALKGFLVAHIYNKNRYSIEYLHFIGVSRALFGREHIPIKQLKLEWSRSTWLVKRWAWSRRSFWAPGLHRCQNCRDRWEKAERMCLRRRIGRRRPSPWMWSLSPGSFWQGSSWSPETQRQDSSATSLQTWPAVVWTQGGHVTMFTSR